MGAFPAGASAVELSAALVEEQFGAAGGGTAGEQEAEEPVGHALGQGFGEPPASVAAVPALPCRGEERARTSFALAFGFPQFAGCRRGRVGQAAAVAESSLALALDWFPHTQRFATVRSAFTALPTEQVGDDLGARPAAIVRVRDQHHSLSDRPEKGLPMPHTNDPLETVEESNAYSRGSKLDLLTQIAAQLAAGRTVRLREQRASTRLVAVDVDGTIHRSGNYLGVSASDLQQEELIERRLGWVGITVSGLRAVDTMRLREGWGAFDLSWEDAVRSTLNGVLGACIAAGEVPMWLLLEDLGRRERNSDGTWLNVGESSFRLQSVRASAPVGIPVPAYPLSLLAEAQQACYVSVDENQVRFTAKGSEHARALQEAAENSLFGGGPASESTTRSPGSASEPTSPRKCVAS